MTTATIRHFATLLLAAAIALPAAAQPSRFKFAPGPKPGGGDVKITVGGDRHTFEAEKDDYAVLQGDVTIEYQDIKIRANKVTYNVKTKDVVAEGNVVIDQGPTRVAATQVVYNLDTKTGTFFNANATMDPSMYFSGDRIEKVDADTYRLENGVFTSCDPDNPAWSFRVGSADITVDDYAHMRNVSFRTRRLPLFWTPRLLWPTKRDRARGFLIPRLVLSSPFGQRLELGYFLPFGESADATLTADLNTAGYYGAGVNVRYLPSENVKIGELSASVVRDPEPEQQEVVPSGKKVAFPWRYHYRHAQDNLPGGFRGVVDMEDFSDLNFFRDYDGDDPRLHTLSTIYSSAYLTKNHARYSLNILADRREILFATREQRFEQLPSLQLRMYPQKIGATPLYLALESSASHLQMSAFDRLTPVGGIDNRTSTNYFRTDFYPTLSMQLRTPAWFSIRPQVSVRETYYSAGVAPGDNPAPKNAVEEAVSRFYAQAQVEVVGPSLSRIFNRRIGGFSRFKHVIEPRFRYLYTTDVTDQDKVIRFDTVDSPYLPIVRDSVEYSLTQRLIGKENTKAGSAREVLSFALRQTVALSKEFTNRTGSAGNTSTIDNKFTPLVATLRLNPYQSITVDANTTFGNVSHQIDQTSFSANLVGTGDNSDKYLGLTWFASFKDPRTQAGDSSQFRINTGSWILRDKLRADVQVNYDAKQRRFLEDRYSLGSTGSCWGVAVAYRRHLDYDPVAGENLKGSVSVAVTLKNVGTIESQR